MTTKWQTYLSENFKEGSNDTFPTSEFTLSDLTHYGLLKVSGGDAESFLQNQLTNDIRKVTHDTHQITAWCSSKGRMIVNFRVFKLANSYILVLSADLIEHVTKKLRMYVMMSKVTIEDVSDSYIHFGVSGEAAKKEINTASNNTLKFSNSNQVLTYKSLNILQVTGATHRFEVFTEMKNGLEDAKTLWGSLTTNNTIITKSNHWLYLEILSGLPNITSDSSEAWIPQMINYTFIDGVDFKKGCYPGQEVVARLNYLGKTKRRMYQLEIDTTNLPLVGDSVSSELDKAAGKILNTVINPQGKVHALAVVKISEAKNPLTLAENSSKITVLELPYSVDDT